MKRRYVVLLNESTKDQDERFKEFIESEKLGWWHWINGTWLLIDYSGKFSANAIRDKISEYYPKVRNLVIEMNELNDTWSGFGPNNEKKNMFQWIKDYWLK